MPTFRKLVRLSAIPFGIWVASIGVAELAFRALGVQLSSSMAIYAPFGEGSYRVKPDVIDVQNWASGRFTTRSDRYGMRCDRDGTGCLEDGDTVDIMVFGDSQGFGQGVENADSIVGVLARDARAEGLRVGNLSIGGHGIANQFELAQDLPADVTPELRQVVLLLGPRSISSPDQTPGNRQRP